MAIKLNKLLKMDYEVIIVGAGPAGATLAYELASKGIKVLLLEKQVLPRYKCCAGGISMKTINILDNNIYKVVEDSISKFIVTFKGGDSYHVEYSQPVICTVMRDKFDYLLVKKAEKAGAAIMAGCEVQGILFNSGMVEVLTSLGNFSSQFVAGADGAGSIIAKSLRLRGHFNYATAIQSEVTVSEEEMTRWKGYIRVDLGRIGGGYGYVFPKSGHLSIGIAQLHSKIKDLKQHYQQFMDSLDIGKRDITKLSSALIPINKGNVTVCQNRAALVGDAAGLVDPLTGEGLYNAILSAKLAAPAFEKSLMQDSIEQLNDYQRAVEERIFIELKIARSFSRLLFQFPHLVFKMLQRDERLERACFYLLRGEIDYTTIMQKLGTIGHLYTLLLQ